MLYNGTDSDIVTVTVLDNVKSGQCHCHCVSGKILRNKTKKYDSMNYDVPCGLTLA